MMTFSAKDVNVGLTASRTHEVEFIMTNFPRDVQYDEEMNNFVDRGIRRGKSA